MCVHGPETRQGKTLNRSVRELGCKTVKTLRGGGGGRLKYIGIFYYEVERK